MKGGCRMIANDDKEFLCLIGALAIALAIVGFVAGRLTG